MTHLFVIVLTFHKKKCLQTEKKSILAPYLGSKMATVNPSYTQRSGNVCQTRKGSIENIISITSSTPFTLDV